MAEATDCPPALVDLAHAALSHWGDRFGQVAIVKYRENAVFSVHDDRGGRFALRLHRPGYHGAAAIRSELAWMRALADAGHPIPAPVPLADGACWVTIASAALPAPRTADLLYWLDGVPLSVVEAAPGFDAARAAALYTRIGEAAARLHEHGRRWTPPADFHRHRWDLAGLVGDAPLWGPFWELPALTDAQRVLLTRVRDALARTLATLPTTGRDWGLIHGDMLADNLIVGAGDVIQPIDFDDCGHGWYGFELATILYFQLDHPSYPVMRDALLAGYRRIRAFDAAQEALLPTFLLLRGLTYLGWVGTRPDTPTAREQTPMLVARACALAATCDLHHPPIRK